MDRHFQCHCGGTAWVDRQEGQLTIHCAKCGATVSGNTLSECRADWRARYAPSRGTPPEDDANPANERHHRPI